MSDFPDRHLRGAQNFYVAARMLKRMHPELAHMCLYAALFWSDAKMQAAEQAGDVPGNPAYTGGGQGAGRTN
jgi:hypothetical protein